MSIRTSPSDNRDTWLRQRKLGLGGSDIAAAVGISPYKTPLELWEEKTGRTGNKVAGEPAYWGTQLEDLVAREFSRRTGMRVQRINYMLTAGENGWMIANIDRAVANDSKPKIIRVLSDATAKRVGRLLTTDIGLECKTANEWMKDQWGPSQENEIKAGNVVSEHVIPLYYETQVQWYMAVTGIRTFYVAVLIGGQDYRIYEVKRDDQLISAIVEKCRDFWFNHVLADVPPDPVNADDIKKLYVRDNGDMAEATNEQASDIGELRTIRDRIKALTEEKEAIEKRVILAIGEKTGLTIGGRKAVTYKAQQCQRFSSAQFKNDHPEMYDDYVRSSSTRVLRLA